MFRSFWMACSWSFECISRFGTSESTKPVPHLLLLLPLIFIFVMCAIYTCLCYFYFSFIQFFSPKIVIHTQAHAVNFRSIWMDGSKVLKHTNEIEWKSFGLVSWMRGFCTQSHATLHKQIQIQIYIRTYTLT